MNTLSRRRFVSVLLATTCLAVVLVSTGCSQDRHVYRSTRLSPKSISIVSLETGKTLWTKDVPVSHQLLIDFSRDGKGGEEWGSANVPADEMDWELWTLNSTARYGSEMKDGKKTDSGHLDLSGEEIIIKVDQLDPEVAAIQ